ncbi:MAG: hypothetical protein R3Y09_13180 [Clostridia bacterium]
MELNKIPFGNQTVTLYNKFTFLNQFNKEQDGWTSYVLHNCLFKKAQETKVSSNVSLQGDFYVVKAPNNDDYLPYRQWVETTSVGDKFTVQDGDVLVLGELVAEIAEGSTPSIDLKDLTDKMFTAKTAQVRVSPELERTSHFYWAG